jgi:hypothetical protein
VAVRKIGPTKNSVTGVHQTLKARSPQAAESALEQDFLTLLEFDSWVSEFEVQPLTIRWRDRAGRARRYTPDVLVRYRIQMETGELSAPPTLFEVKPATVLRSQWASLKPKFRAAIGYARRHGMRFKLVTDRQIRTPRLENARFLLGYRACLLGWQGARERDYLRRLRLKLWALGCATPRQLLEEITPKIEEQAELTPWLWSLVNDGLVGVDLAAPLTMKSLIWTRETPITLREVHGRNPE